MANNQCSRTARRLRPANPRTRGDGYMVLKLTPSAAPDAPVRGQLTVTANRATGRCSPRPCCPPHQPRLPCRSWIPWCWGGRQVRGVGPDALARGDAMTQGPVTKASDPAAAQTAAQAAAQTAAQAAAGPAKLVAPRLPGR